MSNYDATTEVDIISDKTFETIQSSVNKLVDFVRPTFGPSSNKVIIAKNITRAVIDDGVQIARDFELQDPAENAVINIVREVAVRTNDRVGDGTTSSLLILQSIINQVSRRTKRDGRKISLELKNGLDEFKKKIHKSSKQIKTKEDLKKVALIAFDNEEIAEMISELYWKLGKDGTITIDKSPSMETTIEMTDGIKLDRGYLSPYMITNPERMESVIEKPYILITDYRMTEANDIINLMNKMAAENKRELVVIAENMEGSALATAVLNKIQGKFLVVAINAPSGDNRKVTLEDLALLTGARMFTESKGDKLETAEVKDLGRAERFICRREESLIVNPKGKKSDINNMVMMLKSAMAVEPDVHKKEEINRRLMKVTGKVAVIKVGAPTENEQKALKYKVEDAVHAVKAAYTGGIVCGAGLALERIKTSSPILNEALKAPSRQLRENIGVDETDGLKEDEAVNVVTGKRGNFLEVGVVDPVEVLVAGVESAVSIASILVTSTGIIVESIKKPPIEQA